jgi:hypothetical protein
MGFPGEDGRSEIDLHIKFSEVSVKASWAIGHEMGHNVQWLTGFPHSKYGETTNNLWAMYCYEKVSKTQVKTFKALFLLIPALFMFHFNYLSRQVI